MKPIIQRTALLGLTLLGSLGLLTSTAPVTHAAPPVAPVVRTVAGADTAAIQATVDAFRADLGGANNGVGNSFPTGRREINWDGVPDNFAAPNDLQADFFNKNSPRGAVFATPSRRVQVSADADNPTRTPVRFANLTAATADRFTTFSPERLFTAVGSNRLDVTFFVPGTETPATVRGFGAVFTDVDRAGHTTIEYFTAQGQSLGKHAVPVSPDGGLAFLGVTFPGTADQDQVARVRLTSGTVPLLPSVPELGGIDLVAMDDFIYGEPQPLAQRAK